MWLMGLVTCFYFGYLVPLVKSNRMEQMRGLVTIPVATSPTPKLFLQRH